MPKAKMRPLTPAGKPKPTVHVGDLSGPDGNALTIIGRVKDQLKPSHTADEVKQYVSDSMSGDYDHVLAVALNWAVVPQINKWLKGQVVK